MQTQPGVLDLSAYNLPKSDSLSIRIQENFSLYGVRYAQLVVVAIAIGGLTNFAVLLALLLSYLGWAFIMKQSSILDFLPDLGFVNTQDKKMILLLLFNILLILGDFRSSNIDLCGSWMFNCNCACIIMEKSINFTWIRHLIRVRQSVNVK
ncbi:unnamed protein product (macronuclear) [Paramecium tetraurelia]|uniref:PRA1 family protein n=1 Tax=Paramecium tetraurelia TaxID=5888 RepID=A0DFN7_PARTE|nr:uncharacterized protein GSPATT00016667001 [Paramecium tetraurelia]CAK81854.1 unnamed protein product [Paramecium tetraurelia]|eukprot:XP_001449251.1 hypothetical protein (macronuclear) [Paramecium tetraurelia strain d4-2]